MKCVTFNPLLLLLALVAVSNCFAANVSIVYPGDGSDLQEFLDACKPLTTVNFEATPFVVDQPIVIKKAMTVVGLHARLPKSLGKTVLLEVRAEGVSLFDLQLHGNYDTVSQADRSPLVWISKGNFHIERCRFFDSSKDGVMITPVEGEGDLVGGVVHDIVGARIGRDLVSIGGSTKGALVRNVTVTNVRVVTSYFRGAVEVSDGTENISVRDVVAVNSNYAVDVQDHRGTCPPNRNVILENISAIDCKHIVLTANSPRGHGNLILKNITGIRCAHPVVVSHTDNVLIEGVFIKESGKGASPAIRLTGCNAVRIRSLEIDPSDYDGEPLMIKNCTAVERLP